MTPEQLRERLVRGEDSHQQFKRDISGTEMLAAEICAFANSDGGVLLIGIEDDGSIAGLNFADIARINQMVSNTASQSVRPALVPSTENVVLPEGMVMVLRIERGNNGPYTDGKGRIFVKSGADKRQLTAPEELRYLYAQGRMLSADEMAVAGAELGQLELRVFRHYYQTRYGALPEASGESLPLLLEHLNLMRERELTLTGLMLFGRHPKAFRPFCRVDVHLHDKGRNRRQVKRQRAVSFEGRLQAQFRQTLQYLQGHLRQRGRQQIPLRVLEELLVNALVHRDYLVSMPVRILVYDDRIEFVNPGRLVNHLTVSQVRFGMSCVRNPALVSHASHLLPWSGVGEGLPAALALYPSVTLVDDRESNLFRAIIPWHGLDEDWHPDQSAD